MTYTELKYEKKTVEKVLVFMNRLREEFPLNKNVQESWRCCLVVEYFLIVIRPRYQSPSQRSKGKQQNASK